MPRAKSIPTRWKELTLEERRERRRLRREKQRQDNIGRAAKMHAARKTMRAGGPSSMPPLQAFYVGCSGWRYWKWRGLFYPLNLPEGKWFDRYAKRFDDRWYQHDYSKEELTKWAMRIKLSGARRAWIYFNNDNDAYAPKNASAMRRILDE